MKTTNKSFRNMVDNEKLDQISMFSQVRVGWKCKERIALLGHK